MGSLPSPHTFDILIVGGGFSGIYQLHTLRAAGFTVHMLEAGSALGGIWYWNCYPGARVDTSVPCYQFTSAESWATFNWQESFPSRDDIQRYMRHLDDVWDLSKDVSYNSRVVAMRWDDAEKKWCLTVEGENVGLFYSQFVILSTGFASKPYIPPYADIAAFRGSLHHTGLWPQHGVNLKGKRVAVIGTGASGVQLIQNVGKDASHLTVFQRTPNTAIPMANPPVSPSQNAAMRENYATTKHAIATTFAGFDYEFAPGSALKTPRPQRMELYEKLFHTGGLHFWLGTYLDVLFDHDANDEAYAFWRAKTLPRINEERNQELLAPAIPLDPFGTKRISLEEGYFEIFNQSNVELVSTRENAIVRFSEKGIVTADGREHVFDTICLATGFDSITGGITQIDIRGTDPDLSIASKWSKGVFTNLGMTTSGFPNLFFTYGPQAPTAFATGPASAEAQGEWIAKLLVYMRDRNLQIVEATREAEEEYREHVLEIGNKGLFKEARSWYYGDNIPGKAREALNYMAGLPAYKKRCWECAEKGYSGFVLA
jgi:cation diffusion facilitator CzcD-associated flavoprotein CzcO